MIGEVEFGDCFIMGDISLLCVWNEEFFVNGDFFN